MEFVRVENGVVVQRGLPSTGFLKDGRGVSGYDQLPENVLKEEGWLPIVDNHPTYNPDTEYLETVEPTVTDNEVIENYIIKQREPLVQVPTVEDRLVAVEEALLMII
jgi:hypothetical protein